MLYSATYLILGTEHFTKTDQTKYGALFEVLELQTRVTPKVAAVCDPSSIKVTTLFLLLLALRSSVKKKLFIIPSAANISMVSKYQTE